MAVLPIRVYGDPVLRQVCAEVSDPDAVRDLARDMIDTMYDAPGRGLAAPQVAVALRLFVMDCHWKDGVEPAPVVVVNPRILWRSEARAVRAEGCLSIPGIEVRVERPAEVEMAWTDLDGTVRREGLSGFEAVCAQHEFDHLEGVLNTDRVDPETAGRIAPRLDALAAGEGPTP